MKKLLLLLSIIILASSCSRSLIGERNRKAADMGGYKVKGWNLSGGRTMRGTNY